MEPKVKQKVVKILPDDLEFARDVLTGTSLLQQRAAEVRSQKINWQSYMQSQMISPEEMEFITTLEQANTNQKNQILESNPAKCAKLLINLMQHISKEQTIQYILTLIDDLLQEDKKRVEIFNEYANKSHTTVWGPFLHMLNRQDGFIANQSSRIIAKIACWSRTLMGGSDLTYYLTWLKDQMKNPTNEYMQTVARCLQMLMRVEEYRVSFSTLDGVASIMSLLAKKVNFQIQYQLIFCLWCMSFDSKLAEKMSSNHIIPVMSDILADSVKEKVTRITLGTFRHLLESPTNKDVIQANSVSLIRCKVLKQIQLLENNKIEDPEMLEDAEYLREKLQSIVQDLSSFDEYSSELKSGQLEWSPVHKSEKFWSQNAEKFNDKNHEIVKMLIHLLGSSPDPVVLAVACHDIGEYVRHWPIGKKVIEKLGGKQLVMNLLTNKDPSVRYEALVAVQKLMVHNWEYLGKQLDKDNLVVESKTRQAGNNNSHSGANYTTAAS